MLNSTLSNREYFASSDFVYIDQLAFTLHFTCVQGTRFYATNEIFIRALLFFRKLTTYCIRRSVVCCVVRMCCPAPHLQPLLQSPMPFVLSPHSAYSLLSPALLILTFTADCITARRWRDHDAKCANRPGVLYAKCARRVWELLLGLARFMRGSVVVLVVGTVCSQPPARRRVC